MHFLKTAGLPARRHAVSVALVIAGLAWCGSPQFAQASELTVTTLSITSGGSTVSSVSGGTVVTLTAKVQAGGTALKLGQVNFCDANAPSCTDIHLLGTKQLTSAGTAALHFRPGPGSHSYKGVFLGTPDGAGSDSAPVALTVGPRAPEPQTTFTFASISGPVAASPHGTYALTANVGTKGPVLPSGTVSFSGEDAATGNTSSLPTTATLGPVSGGTGFLNVPVPELNNGFADALPIAAIADFNGDGIPDIVSAPHGGVAVSLGNGDGTFQAPMVPNADLIDGITTLGVGDFNADGITDLLIDDEDNGTLTVLLGNGDGTFTVGQSLPYLTASLAVADFNGDGKLDIALPGNPQPAILLGNGDGTFATAPNAPPSTAVQIVAADFNGDGKVDLAVTHFDGSAFTTFTILLGNGDGTFTAAASQPQVPASQLIAADFNGDGKVDLAVLSTVTGGSSTLTILLGNGDGTFSAQPAIALDSNFGAVALAMGDFNGDGKADVAVAVTANNPTTTPAAKVSIFAGKGDGTFAAGFDVPLAVGDLTSLAASDLTGNGSSDLVTFGSVFLGNLAVTSATANNVLPVGENIIQADYHGDADNASSISTNAPSVVVQPAPFSLTSNPVTVPPGASASGSFSVTSDGFSGSLNLSCSISPSQSQTNAPACSVQPSVNFFSAGGTDNGSYTVAAQATTPAGQYSITITATDPIAGTTASTSAAVSVGVQNYQLSNTGATIASPGTSGSSTITISPIGGYTGQVTMSCAVSGGPSDAVNLPTCTVPSPISVTGFTASTTLTLNTQAATTPGSYNVNVTATSTGSLNATTSFAFVVPPAPAGFALSSTAIIIGSPGASATSVITITPSGGFAGNVALSCVVTEGTPGATDTPACSVAAPPAIVGTAAVTATLTVSTTAASTNPSGYKVARTQNRQPAAAIEGSVDVIAALLLFGIPMRRRRISTRLSLLFITFLIGATIGCSGTKVPTPPANPGTTPGSYMVTVNGSSGAITATTVVTVTVK